MQGKIIKGIAGFYYVYAEDGNTYECRAKGIFRKDKRKPLVGDNVDITVLDEKELEGSVTGIHKRRNSLIRPAEELEFLYETYQSCGYQVILSSALKGEGLGEIEAVLKGKTTVVAGPSGVGKSSLTNSLQEEVEMETGEISRKLKRGKHTTRHAQIIPVSQDTFLVDTPGFSSLYIENMEEQELKDYFPEFRKYEGQCRFQGCRHIHEPGCAVKEALENNEISRLRYEDYLELHQELKEKRRY